MFHDPKVVSKGYHEDKVWKKGPKTYNLKQTMIEIESWMSKSWSNFCETKHDFKDVRSWNIQIVVWGGKKGQPILCQDVTA